MKDEFLTITPLGGLEEIGLNCQLWETSKGVVLIDCGIMFPNEQHLGIDVIIPPIDPILHVKNRLLGVVLTHGHEDHIGAIPWLVCFIPGLKIYGSPFTLALVEHKLKERNLLSSAQLIAVTPNTKLNLGNLYFQFISVSHSIPQSYALAVTTPVGKIIHSGDFKIDPTPSDGIGTDLQSIKEFAGNDGIRLFLSDSTNADEQGHNLSEQYIKKNFYEIFSEAKGRIIVTLFASNIERIQTVCDLVKVFNKKLVVTGRSLINNIEKAKELGFLNIPYKFFTDQNVPDLSPEQTVIITTGSQGEPLSALVRIISGEHRYLSIHEGDTVIMSSRVLPNSTLAVNRLINRIYRLGATVCLNGQKAIHVSGHARQDELKILLTVVNPQYFVPIHGEYRQLFRHKELAMQHGIPSENIFILDDGEPLTLLPTKVRKEKKIPLKSILIDGKGIGDVDSSVLRDRQLLGGDGVVVVSLTRDKGTGSVMQGPSILSRGLIFEKKLNCLIEEAKQVVIEILQSDLTLTTQKLEKKICTSLHSFFRNVIGREPIIIPIITEN